MSEGLGEFEEHVSYRPGQQIGTMRTLIKHQQAGALFYTEDNPTPYKLDYQTLGFVTNLIKAGKIRLAERVTVKKRVPEPVAQPAAGAPKDDVSRTPNGLKKYIKEHAEVHIAMLMDHAVIGFDADTVYFGVHPKDKFTFDLLQTTKYFDMLIRCCDEYFGAVRNVLVLYSDDAPDPEQAAAEPESRPIPTCETCPARVESCTAPGVFQCRLHPAPSSPLRDKHFCFQHPALAGLMRPHGRGLGGEEYDSRIYFSSGKGVPIVTAPPTVIPPDRPFTPPFEVTCKENGTC